MQRRAIGLVFVVLNFLLAPFLGRAYFPRTDPGQFVISVKAPTGTRLELTDQYIARVEDDVRQVVAAKDLNMIVSNIGVSPDLSAIYTPSSGMDTAFVQVSLKADHSLSSFAYIDRVRAKLASDLPEIQTYYQTDSIVNQGLPAPFDIQVSSTSLQGGYAQAEQLAQRMRTLHGVSDVLIPQDVDYPGLALDINREQANLEGLTPKTIVDNVITAMNSNGQVAPGVTPRDCSSGTIRANSGFAGCLFALQLDCAGGESGYGRCGSAERGAGCAGSIQHPNRRDAHHSWTGRIARAEEQPTDHGQPSARLGSSRSGQA